MGVAPTFPAKESIFKLPDILPNGTPYRKKYSERTEEEKLLDKAKYLPRKKKLKVFFPRLCRSLESKSFNGFLLMYVTPRMPDAC